MRDAVRNKKRWKRRRTPTQDPSTYRGTPVVVVQGVDPEVRVHEEVAVEVGRRGGPRLRAADGSAVLNADSVCFSRLAGG